MATLQSGGAPRSRVEAGDHVMEAATALGATRTKVVVAARLTGFATQHAAYQKAEGVVQKADGALRKAQEKVGDCDVTQDAAVEGVASGLVSDGFPRVQPFKPLGFKAPSDIKSQGYGDEADTVLKLAAKVKAHKPALPAATKAAAVAVKAANAVKAALVPIAALTKARTAAISRRDALEQPWETAFASLKRATRAAEDEGAKGLFDALFGSAKPKAPTAKAKAKKAAKAKKGAEQPA